MRLSERRHIMGCLAGTYSKVVHTYSVHATSQQRRRCLAVVVEQHSMSRFSEPPTMLLPVVVASPCTVIMRTRCSVIEETLNPIVHSE